MLSKVIFNLGRGGKGTTYLLAKNEHRWLMGGRALPAGGSAGLFLSPMGHLYTSAKGAVQTRDKTLERCDCSVFWEAFPPLPVAGTMLVL